MAEWGRAVQESGTGRSHVLPRATGAASAMYLFVLSGIATVLITRAFLAQAGYPKLSGGGGSLHIAHMLWGGLLMMAAILLTLCFIGRAARCLGALVGGVGFGLFIDEVGKQVTDEPGYFYRPAAGIIYATFAALLLLTRLTRRRTAEPARLTAEQRTANAADLALTAVTSGLTAEQRQTALRLVGDSARDVDRALVHLLATVPERAPAGRRRSWATGGVRALRRLARTRVAVALACLCVLTEALMLTVWIPVDFATGELADDPQVGASVGILLSAAVSTALAVAGLARLRRDQAAAFRLFRMALLTDVLVGQVFKFTVNQFAAVTELAFDLGVLWVLSVHLASFAERRPAGRHRPRIARAAPG
ncbi:hypothetical protein [Streptomyces litchfieldiae]|uniref:Integral membrane protein n=1 Tax=Streptomyces litchfieldiae TaxID=3075543 RepID=A0ABU2MPR2_9ACTN|nr:hypothetical protein [Streptomyces sp. DSM 44938]MDT0343601.1 hypothetical protein [Streptomyces sp. DSM 44938]